MAGNENAGSRVAVALDEKREMLVPDRENSIGQFHGLAIAKARKNPSTISQGASRLSTIEGKLQTMRAEHESTVQHYLNLLEAKDKGGLSNFGACN